MNNDLEFATKLALKAGNLMLKYFETNLDTQIKKDQSLVSLADEEINQLVINEAARNYPTYSVFGEEASSDKHSEYVWVCDPIDGTVPYIKGVPISVFSIALVKNGAPIVGVVYDPFMKRLYSAVKGQGAFLNNSPIKVSNKKLDRQAVIDIEIMPRSQFDFNVACHNLSLKTGVYILRLGSTVNACCLVASGKYEACIFDGSHGKNMDIAAIKVIVEEAGGKVTDLFGQDQRYDQDIKGAIVSNGIIHPDLVGLI